MTMKVDVEMKHVVLPNGETLYYRERSGGEKKVLLVHGNMTSSKHWDLVLEHMDPSFKLYAVDLRGFGLSTYNQPIESIKDFAHDLKLFVDAIQLTDFSLVGWSLGGTVCMQFVIDYPRVCDKLVLLASGSTRGYPMYALNEDGTVNVNKRYKTLKEVEEDLKTKMVQGAYDDKNREFLRQTWDSLIYTNNKPDKKRYEEYIDDMLTQRNLAHVYHVLNLFNISSIHNGVTEGTDEAKKITIPTLVLQGDRDLVVPQQMCDEILEDLNQEYVTYVQLKDCGHSPLVDDLDQLLHHLTNFLK